MTVQNLLLVFCPSLCLSPPFLRLLVEHRVELFSIRPDQPSSSHPGPPALPPRPKAMPNGPNLNPSRPSTVLEEPIFRATVPRGPVTFQPPAQTFQSSRLFAPSAFPLPPLPPQLGLPPVLALTTTTLPSMIPPLTALASSSTSVDSTLR